MTLIIITNIFSVNTKMHDTANNSVTVVVVVDRCGLFRHNNNIMSIMNYEVVIAHYVPLIYVI